MGDQSLGQRIREIEGHSQDLDRGQRETAGNDGFPYK